jgi:hypothetical protein
MNGMGEGDVVNLGRTSAPGQSVNMSSPYRVKRVQSNNAIPLRAFRDAKTQSLPDGTSEEVLSFHDLGGRVGPPRETAGVGVLGRCEGEAAISVIAHELCNSD